jgi:peroxiredoxin
MNGHWMVLAAGLMVAWCVGCRGGSTPEEIRPPAAPGHEQAAPEQPATEGQPKETETTKETGASAVETPAAEQPAPEPPKIPEVLLTKALRDTCLVFVGDPMPEAELPDLAGQKQPLDGLFGDKLTVVFFWTGGTTELSAMAGRNALEDLQKEVYEPYGEKGVEVIAVNEGDTPEAVKKLVDEAGITFPNLLDSDGAYLAKVAKAELPRPYLLDAEGKILWFDLEFSPTTREKLMQAIQVAMASPKGAEPPG